ncbi:MAG: ParB N-terminal domain-containing protein [Trueperaceae bacterium]
MKSKFDDLARRKSAQPLEHIRALSLSSIRLDGGTQAREGLSDEAIQDYTAVIENDGELPNITVFFDGTYYWLADGFHRYHAHERAKRTTISSEIKEGTQREAILYAVGANEKHGLRRTNADKRQAVKVLLNDSEWRTWSSREIGRRCGVDHKTVEAIRKETSGEFPQIGERNVSRNGQVYKAKTKSKPKATPKKKLEQTFISMRKTVEKVEQEEIKEVIPIIREAYDYLADLLSKLEGKTE